MNMMMELQKTVERLDDNGKLLLLEIAKRFLLSDDWDDDVLSENDIHLISLAENEYINGETTSHNDIKWK
ncbi:MAG: hypothetical protein FWC92_07170 [Defluviitaleaceae bacterium]|nr:hypothetical protein [Defluviitaleaceae bacterium]